MNLHIKNMVCNRCIMAVHNVLKAEKLHPVNVSLGMAVIEEKKLTGKQKSSLQHSLSHIGFELIDDKKSKIIEQIKNVVIEHVHYSEPISIKFSKYLSEKLHQDYSSLSKLFSESEGMTIEHFLIHQKIERVKELLVYNERSLSEIAFELGYSSVAHLSAQFKKVTGLTPSFYRSGVFHKRNSLDKIR